MSDAPPPDGTTPDPSGPAAPAPPAKRAFTLDLSSPGAAARPKRPKGFVPVVQKTINLTTKRAEKPADVPGETPPAPAPAAGRSAPPAAPGRQNRDDRRQDDRRRDDRHRDGGRPGGGTSLADLLDEATLARLRGGA